MQRKISTTTTNSWRFNELSLQLQEKVQNIKPYYADHSITSSPGSFTDNALATSSSARATNPNAEKPVSRSTTHFSADGFRLARSVAAEKRKSSMQCFLKVKFSYQYKLVTGRTRGTQPVVSYIHMNTYQRINPMGSFKSKNLYRQSSVMELFL